MNVLVRAPDNQVYTFQMSPHDTIRDLKKKYSNKSGSNDKVSLLFLGKVLDSKWDGKTLSQARLRMGILFKLLERALVVILNHNYYVDCDLYMKCIFYNLSIVTQNKSKYFDRF